MKKREAGGSLATNNVKRAAGATALMYSCQQGDQRQVQNIIATKPWLISDRERTGKTALHYCAESEYAGAPCAAELLKTAPELIGSVDQDGYTPLHLAVIAGNLSLLRLLYSHGADINAVDNEGHTPLHWATVCNELECLEEVLAVGGNPNVADMHGGCPVHYAAQMSGTNSKSGLNALKLLLSKGAHPNPPDNHGRQPILWAASAGNSDAIVSLVNAGGSVEAADKDGLTALHCAASRGHTECLETLFNLCGAEINVIDTNGCSALFYAVTLGHADATQLLLKHGASTDIQDRKGRTAVHCGAAKGQLETVKVVAASNGDLWGRTARGDYPLHDAVASGRRALVTWLLQRRPDAVNAPNNDGRCPLHIAAIYNDIDMCKTLLDSGSLVNPVMRTGKGGLATPLDAALHKGHRACAKYLQSHGGVPASRLDGKAAALRGPARKINLVEEKDEKTDNIKKNNFATNTTNVFGNSSSLSLSTHKEVTMTAPKTKVLQVFVEDDVEIRRIRHPIVSDSSIEETVRRRRRRKKIKRNEKYSDEKDHYYTKTDLILSSDEASKSDNEVIVHRNEKIKREFRDVMKDKNKNRHTKIDDSQKLKIDDDHSSISLSNDEKPLKSHKKNNILGNESHELNVHNHKENENIQIVKAIVHNENSRDQKVDIINEDDETKNASENVDTGDNNNNISKITDTNVCDRDSKINKKISEQKNDDTENNKEVKIKKNLTVLDLETQIIDGTTQKTADDVQDKNTKNKFEENDKKITKDEVTEIIASSKSVVSENKEITTDQEVLDLQIQSINDKNLIVEKSNSVDIKQVCGISSEIVSENKLNEETSISQNEKPITDLELINGKYEETLNSKELLENLADNEKNKINDDKDSAIISTEYIFDENEILESEMEKLNHIKNEDEDIASLLINTDKGLIKVLDDENDFEQAEPVTTRKTKRKRDNINEINVNERSVESFEILSSPAEEEEEEELDSEPNQSPIDIDSSQLPDSGIEPSPRRMKSPMKRTKKESSKNIRSAKSSSSKIDESQKYDNTISVTQAVQYSMRKYHLERRIFHELLELKRLQIRAGRANEAVLVKRLVDDYRRAGLMLGLQQYEGVYTFRAFEKYLYEQLRLLQSSEHKIIPRLKSTDDLDRLTAALKKTKAGQELLASAPHNASLCTEKTHRCHHAAHAYTGIPCAAYITKFNHHTMPKSATSCRSGFLPKLVNDENHAEVARTLRHVDPAHPLTLELSHGQDKQIISLPTENLDKNKRYFVTFTIKGSKDQFQEEEKPLQIV